MVRLRSTETRTRLIVGVAAVALTAVLVLSSPWYIPWLVWTEARTPYVHSMHTPYYAVDNSGANFSIPRVIHQTWKDNNIPPEWQAARQSCLDIHPGYEYKLWTDASSEAFVEAHYPKLAHTYRNYPYVIQRADAIRYAILHHYGGLYIDLDIVCLHPLDFLRTYGFVMPKTWPVGFSNDFLAGAPKHPFLEQMVSSLPSKNWELFSKYATVMFSTGPMFVTAQATAYRRTASYHRNHNLAVLPDDMYGKYVVSPDPLFEHLHGSSWHGDDAKSVLWFLKHPIVVGAVLFAALAAVAVQLVMFRLRSSQAYAAEQAESSLNKMC